MQHLIKYFEQDKAVALAIERKICLIHKKVLSSYGENKPSFRCPHILTFAFVRSKQNSCCPPREYNHHFRCHLEHDK
uniref:Uncharacterized protein n=1 Tax=Arundo donax TaxID=35708 RepID=A0A0A9DYT2_ARUDO